MCEIYWFKLSGWIVQPISGEVDKCFAFHALPLVFFIFLFLYCKHLCLVLVWLFVAHFSTLVGDFLVPLLIIMELFLWSGWLVIFTLALRGFPHQINCVFCVLLISMLHSIFYWCFSQVLASLGEFISTIYCSVIEFVIVLICFSHQSLAHDLNQKDPPKRFPKNTCYKIRKKGKHLMKK